MTSANRFVDDLSRVMTGAAGVAQGALKEGENAMKGWTQKWVSDQGFITREEFNAVATMASNARAEAEALKVQVANLQKEIDALKANAKK